MKLVFIINSLGGGGAERILQTLTTKLVEKNYEIFIVLLEKGSSKYLIHKDVKIITLKSSIFLKGFGKILFIPFQAVELYFLINKINAKKSISFLVRANLVHCCYKFFSKSEVVISERSLSIRHYDKANLKSIFMNFLIKNLYKKANSIIAISDGIKDSLIKNYGIDSNNIKTIYNPISILKEKKESIDFYFDKNFIHFITVGRLIPLKDHKTMIEAFKICNEVNTNTKLIILGEGPLENEITKLINDLNLQKNIFLLGFKDNVFDYLKESSIFVFSSKFEGFGNVIVEAMGCGLPVISTDCPSGPSEILDNGRYGMLTSVGNVCELTNAMTEMINKDNFDKYKELSLKRFQDFDVSIITNEYLKILKKNENYSYFN